MNKKNKRSTTDEQLHQLFTSLVNQPDQYEGMPIKKIAIISTPRSGSSLFCNILRNTGMLGYPIEWVNMRYLTAYGNVVGKKDVDIGQYLEFIYRKTTSSNGFFSINFHVSHYTELKSMGIDLKDMQFDKFYYLSRKDKLAQAYSFSKASLTDQWGAGSKATSDLPESIPLSHIFSSLAHISKSEADYELHLKEWVSKEFHYEDFSQLSKTNAFDTLFKECSVEPKSDLLTDMKRQSSGDVPREIIALKNYLQCQ